MSTAKSEVKLPKEVHFYTNSLSQAANRDSHSAYRVISLVTDLSYNPDIRRWESASHVDCGITIEEILAEAAEQGYAPAQYKLGCMLASKEGASGTGYKESIALWEKAAEQYYLPAYNMLGYIYHHGIGVDQDYQKALDWYRDDIDGLVGRAQVCKAQDEIELVKILYKRAAAEGDARSQLWVADILQEEGLYVDGKGEDAMHYYYMAARQGLPQAQYVMGISYASGVDVKKNPEQAYRYLRIAMRGFEKEGIIGGGQHSAAQAIIDNLIDDGDLTRARGEELEKSLKRDLLSVNNTVDKYRTKDYLIFRTC